MLDKMKNEADKPKNDERKEKRKNGQRGIITPTLLVLITLFIAIVAMIVQQWTVVRPPLEIGHQSFDNGNYEAAIRSFTHIIDASESSFIEVTEAYFMRGLAYEHLRNYEEALANYEVVLERDPDYYDGLYWGMGNAYYQTEQYEQSLEAYETYIERNGSDAPGWMHRRVDSLHAEQQ